MDVGRINFSNNSNYLCCRGLVNCMEKSKPETITVECNSENSRQIKEIFSNLQVPVITKRRNNHGRHNYYTTSY